MYSDQGQIRTIDESRIRTLNLNPDPEAPAVLIEGDNLLGPTEFMIDTGAAINLVKMESLCPNTLINYKDRVRISGISHEKITTRGSTNIKILGYDVKAQAVPNDFPIEEGGILGLPFLKGNSKIDLIDSVLEWKGYNFPFINEPVIVPPRSVKTLPIRIQNTKLSQGYIPRLAIGKGIYAGEAAVTNNNGLAYIKVYNTTEDPCEIMIPTMELQEIDSNCTLTDSKILRYTKEDYKDEERIRKIIDLLRLNHLNEEEMEHTLKLIETYYDLFHLPEDELLGTEVTSHHIATTDNQPIHVKQYRFPPAHKEEIVKQINTLLKKKIIEPSSSPYNSPLWIVPKKPDSRGNKQWRMVIDYRMLNEKTIGDAYPLPNITEILDQLGSAKYFSIFDLASGFHQIPMNKEDAAKTAFSTPYGHYQFNRMPFGLKNAPATFQRLMDQVLTGLQGTELFVYLDDIVLYASSLQEHAIKFKKLAEKLRNSGLRLQPDKCEFLRKEVTYLGHIINKNGVKPDPKKLTAVKEFPTPRNSKNIKQFLGLGGYYRRFIPNFSKIAKPLTELLKKDANFEWTEKQQTAFDTLKTHLCSEPLLQYPDFTKPFVLTTDASGYAIGGILSQGPIGKDLPIAYTSRLLTGPEINYSTIEKELLAIIYCVAHFRSYLYGHKFQLVTDHKPLIWLHSVKDPTSRLIRWRLKLAEYEYEVVYKAGKINVNADALSRNPIPELPAINNSLQEERSNVTQNNHKTNKRIVVSGTTREYKASRNQKDKRKKKSKIKGNLFNVLPMHRENDDDSDSEPIFEPSRNKSINDNNDDNDADITDKERDNGHSDNNNSDASSEVGSDISSPESELFDNPNPPYTFNKPDFQIIRDHFNMRNDNLVIFVTKTGEPCDEGARIFIRENPTLDFRNHTLGRAKIIKQGKRRVIALTIKEKSNQTTDVEILKESLHSLLDVVNELQIDAISMCKSNAAEISWDNVKGYLQRVLSGIELSIMVCTNQIETPSIEKRKDIIIENHVSAIGGHKGITKTYYRIKQKYYWPRMKYEIANFINNCRECQLKKLVRIKNRQEMILTDTPDAAFDKVSMDIMGPLPTSPNNNNYILTIQDLLTKFSLAIPLKNAGAIDVANAFVNDFICLYGTPKAILTDQGSHFINSLMKNIARKFRILHFRTTAYRPQANGSVERSHQVLWEYLKQFVANNDWDEYLKLATFSYNTSVHEGTKYTPYELVFGRIARVPTADPPIDEEQNESYTAYLSDLYNRLRNVQEGARENLIVSKIKSKQYYDKRVRPYKFNIGDKVFLLKEPNKGKLSDQYTGPYSIIKILPKNNVQIKINDKRTRVVHSDKLKIARGTNHDEDIPTVRRITKRNNEIPKESSKASTKLYGRKDPASRVIATAVHPSRDVKKQKPSVWTLSNSYSTKHPCKRNISYASRTQTVPKKHYFTRDNVLCKNFRIDTVKRAIAKPNTWRTAQTEKEAKKTHFNTRIILNSNRTPEAKGRTTYSKLLREPP